jgi:hypothetical protein
MRLPAYKHPIPGYVLSQVHVDIDSSRQDIQPDRKVSVMLKRTVSKTRFEMILQAVQYCDEAPPIYQVLPLNGLYREYSLSQFYAFYTFEIVFLDF